ncbi:MAG: fibronectin type III domain-containing protein, partial [Clostridia bacterium]|nr:fibronectin type III domain-containing protein [Clostridia bacterium]
ATECKAPKITSVTSPSKSKATVKWSNVDGETGYQVYYSTKKTSGFKKVDSYSANKLTGSKSFSGSASGKTIYFKVRAYKKVAGQTIYSEWSAVKSVKIK